MTPQRGALVRTKNRSSRSARKMFRPNWQAPCENCGAKPSVPLSGLCGPCHFGAADAKGGGWWNDGDDDFDEDFVEEHM